MSIICRNTYQKILFVFACVIVGTVVLPSAQIFGQEVGEFEWLKVTGWQFSDTKDWAIVPSGPPGGTWDGLLFEKEDPERPGSFIINAIFRDDTPAGALSLGKFGLGIGDAFGADFPLHIAGGGTDDAFSNASIHVEHRRPSPGFQEMLTLKNTNGGGLRINLSDGGDNGHAYTFDNYFGHLWINDYSNPNITTPLRIDGNAGTRGS